MTHDHLGFALRYESLDLLVLKRVFEAVPVEAIGHFVRNTPKGASNRRAWFLYEFLTDRTLDLPEVSTTAIDLLDRKTYFTGLPQLARRRRRSRRRRVDRRRSI
jgi:hypothetical protein